MSMSLQGNSAHVGARIGRNTMEGGERHSSPAQGILLGLAISAVFWAGAGFAIFG